jgi:CubicO group peptidase (beta-lactamase class C family)
MRRTTGAVCFCLAWTASLGWAQTPVPAAKPADSPSPGADAIDEVISSEMQRRQIPGLSLAVIEDGRIKKVRGYGVTEKGGQTPVTPSTLFQAGSISKPVSAMGALRLVEQGKLALDDDVNAKLLTWKVPENEFTKDKKVSLRGLLSHTAGLTVHGFPGYATDEPRPTIVQILDGAKPANTSPIRVDVLPGSIWRYSGGGYTIMQQLVIDVTAKPFPQFMQEAVLAPLEMKESTFEQPLPDDTARRTATGHYRDRTIVKGKWHIYPEMAAAGLWTTPSDLARFAVGLQQAAAGKSGKTLSQGMARQMLTDEKDGYGLGVGVEGSGPKLRFGHGGRDEGFDARLVAYAETGQGAAIMINANDNSQMVSRILDAIAREYHWPDYPKFASPKLPAVQVAEDQLVACTGRYELANNQMLTLESDEGRLFTVVDGFPDEEFVADADDHFRGAQRNVELTFHKDGSGAVNGLTWKEGGGDRNAPRIGPLFRHLKPRTDPDPARTEKVMVALRAFGQGGTAIADSPALTPGVRTDLGRVPHPDLAAVKSVIFLADQDVSGRKIERHKGVVNRIIHYRLITDKPDRCLLVHMTADGLITDYDIVAD